MTLEWIAEEMEGISHYFVESQQMFPNETMGLPENITFEAEFPGGGELESRTIENLEPGFLYMIAIQSIRADFESGNISEASLAYFQTSPDVPNSENITITLETNMLPEGQTPLTLKANITWPELDGHVNYYCINYTNIDDGVEIGPKCIKHTQSRVSENTFRKFLKFFNLSVILSGSKIFEKNRLSTGGFII
jgi:hypothetical protein